MAPGYKIYIPNWLVVSTLAVFIIELTPITKMILPFFAMYMDGKPVPITAANPYPLLSNQDIFLLVISILTAKHLNKQFMAGIMLDILCIMSVFYAICPFCLPCILSALPGLVMMKAIQVAFVMTMAKGLFDEEEKILAAEAAAAAKAADRKTVTSKPKPKVNQKPKPKVNQKPKPGQKVVFIKKSAAQLDGGVDSAHYELNLDQKRMITMLRKCLIGHMHGQLKPLHLAEGCAPPVPIKKRGAGFEKPSPPPSYAADQKKGGPAKVEEV